MLDIIARQFKSLQGVNQKHTTTPGHTHTHTYMHNPPIPDDHRGCLTYNIMSNHKFLPILHKVS